MAQQVEAHMQPRDEWGSDRGIKDVWSDMTGDVGQLVKKEVELAKVEVKEKLQVAAKAGAAFAGVGVTAFLAVQVLSFAAAFGLAQVLPTWLAFAIVGVVYLLVCGALFMAGRKKLAEFNPAPEQTLQSVKQDVQLAKASFQRGMSGPANGSGSASRSSTYPGRMWSGD